MDGDYNSLNLKEIEEEISRIELLKKEAAEKEDFAAALKYKNQLEELEKKVNDIKGIDNVKDQSFNRDKETFRVTEMETNENQRYNFRNWMPNDCADGCLLCGSQFAVFKRRHHCRNCGLIFCSNCTKNRIALPEVCYTMEARVCDKCYKMIHPSGKKTELVYNPTTDQWITKEN